MTSLHAFAYAVAYAFAYALAYALAFAYVSSKASLHFTWRGPI